MRKLVLVVCALLVAALLPVHAEAQTGKWLGRVRVISVSPNDSSDEIDATGSEVSVDSAVTAEVDVTYLFNDRVGLEVIAATSKHDLGASGGDLAGADLGEVSVLPPTITLQYRFASETGLHPYVGLGVNFTLFYSYDLSADLRGLGVTDVEFDNSFGVAGNLGLDIDAGERWLVNIDVKYISITTDAAIKAGPDTLDKVSVDINPWVFGVGVGYRF